MSADSPRKISRGGGIIVRPQPVSDKSVVESVVDFFQDVAYSHGTPKQDDKEKIQWVRFESSDINDINVNPDCSVHSSGIPPLLLILGYTNGVQVWALPGSGEAHEVLSLRQGPVKCLVVLPHPQSEKKDAFASKRPLLAVCDASSAGQPFCSVKFVSLRSGDEIHKLRFDQVVANVKANNRLFVVTFKEKLTVYDTCKFEPMLWINTCFPCPGLDPNPVAIGSRWLAYADKQLTPMHQSCGGMSGDGGQSYAATVISAAKTVTKGMTSFGESVFSSLTGYKSHGTSKKPVTPAQVGYRPGIVTVLDTQKMSGQVNVQEDGEGVGLVAHFPAHATEPVAALAFDPSGTMLLTCDRLGHNFHLYRIMVHPWSCSLGAVHHLYTLYRGDTTAKVQDISFTVDSRWVAVSTLRGTTHVFPITPYGGPVNVRTHARPSVVNRASRFQRSSGIDELDTRSSGRHSPVAHSSSPSSSPGRQHEYYRQMVHQNTINNNVYNPRLPPYPHPSTIHPLVQIKQTLAIPGLGTTTSATGKAKPKPGGQGPPEGVECVAACFAPSRGWVAGSPSLTRDMEDDNKTVDSLFVVSWQGHLVEYILDVRPKVTAEKFSDESPMEMTEIPRAQWTLTRNLQSPEIKPPLCDRNPLVLATEAVMSQQPSHGTLERRQESRESLSSNHSQSSSSKDDSDDQWLSQVEIITHSGPHRRLWMGPQFSFKTFQGSGTTTVLSSNSSVLLSHSPETQVTSTDLADELDLQSLKVSQAARSSPIAMQGGSGRKHRHSSGGSDTGTVSVMTTGRVIEVGSYEPSPSSIEAYHSWPDSMPPVQVADVPDDSLTERLADAMCESPSQQPHGGPASCRNDIYLGSVDNLSTSSGSISSGGGGGGQSVSFDVRPAPPHMIENVLVFPSANTSSPPNN